MRKTHYEESLIFTIRREVRMRWSLLSPFMAQAPLQVINLLLHVSGILLIRDVAFTPRLTLIGAGSMYTSLLVSPSLKFTEMILTLRPHGFCLV